MTEKIDWYKEVLELEPNSKVFFPLARMLAEEQRFTEAVDVLTHGLARHDEFLEARLFLIELLHKSGQRAACDAQIEKLSGMFSAYAGFWQAWAACLSSGNAPDAASALRFLAAHFLRGPISLHEVLDRGVASLLGDVAAQDVRIGIAAPSAHVAQDTQEAEFPLEVEAGEDALLPLLPDEGLLSPDPLLQRSFANGADDEVFPEEAGGESFDPDTAMADDEALPELNDAPAPELPVAHSLQPDENEDGEEHFSLRTRSMAEVLAEQGDVKGALDIYHELAAAAVAPEESADLQQRISTLSARLGSAMEAAGEEAPQQEAGADGKDKLISMLEALAERVEARAQS